MYELEITFVALFLGSLIRILYPLTQLPDGTSFDKRYIGTMISALITSFIVAGMLITNITIPDTTVPKLILFVTAFLQGWGATDLFNKVGIDWRKPQ